MDMDQMNIDQHASSLMHDAMCKHTKVTWMVAAAMAGAVLVGAGAYLAWNSRQAKLLRATKRAANVLYKTGTVLQSVADAARS